MVFDILNSLEVILVKKTLFPFYLFGTVNNRKSFCVCVGAIESVSSQRQDFCGLLCVFLHHSDSSNCLEMFFKQTISYWYEETLFSFFFSNS